MAYYDKKNKNWTARWSVGGKRKSKSGFAMKKFAEIYEAQRKIEYEKGLIGLIEQTDIEMEDIFNKYLRYIQMNKRPSTVYTEKNRIRNWTNFFIDKNINFAREIDSVLVNLFVLYLMERKKSNCHIRGCVGTFRLAMEFALETGLIKFMPVEKWPKIKASKPKDLPRYFTIEEMNKIEKRLKDKNIRLYYVVYILARTGMRIGELRSLKKENIDFEKGFITLNPDNTKSGYMRWIPISKGVEEILKIMISEKNEFIFTTSRGNQLNITDIYKMLVKHCENIGIKGKGVNVHCLRRTFISHAIMGGEDLTRVMAIVGHKDWSTVKKYLHLSPGFVSKEVNLPY